MVTMTVCCRFRPLSSKEKRYIGNAVCVHCLDTETFVFKDEKEEELSFSFDKVFYEDSAQNDVYQFLGLPIVQDAVNAINGTIIAYGQTGAGKTYSMEGPSVLELDELKKGLLPRVVDGLFDCVKSADSSAKYTIKLSMVEIYMEKVRDLLDLKKDNILIKESKVHGIWLSGVTEISISDPAEALQNFHRGIINRAVGETQMNMASSRSHCIYIFTVHQKLADKRVKTGKVILVDLAGSEKVEKTGAEGKVLEEAKFINKSLSALGNVINALTGSPAKASHISYCDSKLTRILQGSLGGNSRTGLLCCCSPSPSNSAETLSTLRFGTRAKHIKASPIVNISEPKTVKKQMDDALTKDEACERVLNGESSLTWADYARKEEAKAAEEEAAVAEAAALAVNKYKSLIKSEIKDIQKDQCWAISIAEVLEAHYNRNLNGNRRMQLSPQFLIDSINTKYDSVTCFKRATKHLIDVGLPSESKYPWTGIKKAPPKKLKAKKIRNRSAKELSEEDEVIPESDVMELMEGGVGPLVLVFDTDSSVVHLQPNEVYKAPKQVVKKGKTHHETNLLPHGVVAIGYGTTHDFQNYWTVRSCYSDTWCDNGYGKFCRSMKIKKLWYPKELLSKQ